MMCLLTADDNRTRKQRGVADPPTNKSKRKDQLPVASQDSTDPVSSTLQVLL